MPASMTARRTLMRMSLFKLLCLAVGFFLIVHPGHAQPEPAAGAPPALLIANSAYGAAEAASSLPAENANALAEELRHAGFAAEVRENLGKTAMQRAIEDFTEKIKPGEPALFFFSGYGIQAKGSTYLIPVDADIWTEADVRARGIRVADVTDAMEAARAKPKLIVLDASRRNPFERRFRSLSAGLGAMALPAGSLLISSADLGKVIDESEGDSSIFIGELLKEMRAPDLTADEVFNRTRIGVSRATNGAQRPFVSSSLGEDFFFGPHPGVPSSEPGAPAQAQASARKSKQQQDPRAVIGLPAGELTPGTIFRDCADCPDLVVVPAGEFNMGSEDFDTEKPIHPVLVEQPFAVGRTEVTFAQWDACVAAGGCRFRPDDHGRGRTNLPVSEVSWNDARAYVDWLARKTGHGYRLLSEAEWEYVARAGTATPFWWGADARAGYANCRGCGGSGGRRTLPVGSYQANAFGLSDTAGNVAEWVEDCWTDSYAGASGEPGAEPAASCKRRVLRGGSFDAGARYARSASRFLHDADKRYYLNGFRVMRDLP